MRRAPSPPSPSTFPPTIASTAAAVPIALMIAVTAASASASSPPAMAAAWSIPFLRRHPPPPPPDYDLAVIGAGASGLFAAGTARSVGFRTLLVDRVPEGGEYGSGGGRTPGGDDDDDDDRGGGTPEFHLGGDCTNAACVPSKAVRSVAGMARDSRRVPPFASSGGGDGGGGGGGGGGDGDGARWLNLARHHAHRTVSAVRGRESPSRIASSGLDVEFVSDCHFVSDRELNVTAYDNSTWLDAGVVGGGDGSGSASAKSRIVTSRRFLIATGASPVVPSHLRRAAERCGLPLHTYRTVLRPSPPSRGGGNGGIWDMLGDDDDDDDPASEPGTGMRRRRRRRRRPRIVIAGGGAAACELGQSLSRLGGTDWDVAAVAPTVLPGEDASLRSAAMRVLTDDGVTVHLGRRVTDVIPNEGGGGDSPSEGKARVVLDDNRTFPADALVLCVGRTPGPSLSSLRLDDAGVAWDDVGGVATDPYLRSVTARNVYAAGDCASSVPPRDRRAAHAGWTGFHSVRNALLPPFLRSPAVHGSVPRVVYTDPEVAAAGMTEAECARAYGSGGFVSLRAGEVGTDRADADGMERDSTVGFVELRAARITGRVLGGSACGPAAAELVNEIALAVSCGLTVRDLARSIHSYPSHGYLLHRVALSMATSTMDGLLAACGPVGRVLSASARAARRVMAVVRPLGLPPQRRRARREMREWEAEGASDLAILRPIGDETASWGSAGGGSGGGRSAGTVDGVELDRGCFGRGGGARVLSFLDVCGNETLRRELVEGEGGDSAAARPGEELWFGRDAFVRWYDRKPQ